MLLFNTKSFLRQEEYRALQNLHVDGEILDVGGSKKSGYLKLIKGKHTVLVANIDASYDVDIIFDAEKPWPLAAGRFNCVLFVNLLEHLFEYQHALREASRVLHSEGRIVGVVPFMFPVHGSPCDYFRFTHFALQRMLKNAGFHNIIVKELGTGAFSVVYHALIGFVRWNWLVRPLTYWSRINDRFLLFLKKDNKMSAKFMPLGYYFEATK